MPITASITNVGRVRSNNEDSFLSRPDIGLYIVCDGMGGHNGGEVASKSTCDVLNREIEAAAQQCAAFQKSGAPNELEALRLYLDSALQTACKEVFKQAAADSALIGMGTTCTVLWVVSPNKAILGHVGDSRLYMLRSGTLHQLSEDHTYVGELVKRGKITEEQARTHPQRNVLARALGVQPSVMVDTLAFDIDAGDTFLLCSDGVYNYFPDNNELLTQLNNKNLPDALESIVKLALDRGGRDNCTCVCVRLPPHAEGSHAGIAADQRITVLKKIPIFAHLTYNELIRVLGVTRLTQISAGQTIIKEGDQGDEFFIILAGDISVEKNGQRIALLSAGTHIGEMAMVDNAPRSASAIALSDVNLLIMRREGFFAIIRTEPVIASKLLWSFVKVLSTHLRNTNEALTESQTQKEKTGLKPFDG